MTHRAKWAQGLLVAVASVGLGCLLATHGEAASPSPRVVAVVPISSGHMLQQRDARTLRPVRGGWSRTLDKYASTAALSPSGSRIAVEASGDSLLVLDAVTGRIVRQYRDVGSAFWIYWLGGDGTVGSDPELLIAQNEGCSSGGCGPEYTDAGSQYTMASATTRRPRLLSRTGSSSRSSRPSSISSAATRRTWASTPASSCPGCLRAHPSASSRTSPTTACSRSRVPASSRKSIMCSTLAVSGITVST